MSRYFEEMSAAIEAHGGTVEKFIGDAVMAVFGVPTVHEDDALRAVRAAAEMRQRLARAQRRARAEPTAFASRCGSASTPARSSRATPRRATRSSPATPSSSRSGSSRRRRPGEILIGKATYPLVRDAVDAGPLQTFRAKGKSEPVPSRRVDEVRAGAGRHRATPRRAARRPRRAELADCSAASSSPRGT